MNNTSKKETFTTEQVMADILMTTLEGLDDSVSFWESEGYEVTSVVEKLRALLKE